MATSDSTSTLTANDVVTKEILDNPDILHKISSFNSHCIVAAEGTRSDSETTRIVRIHVTPTLVYSKKKNNNDNDKNQSLLLTVEDRVTIEEPLEVNTLEISVFGARKIRYLKAAANCNNGTVAVAETQGGGGGGYKKKGV